jgi:DNA-binding XRE family transcriptional regulator
MTDAEGDRTREAICGDAMMVRRVLKIGSMDAMRDRLAALGINKSKATMGHWESGHARPTRAEAAAIATVLGCKIEDLRRPPVIS